MTHSIKHPHRKRHKIIVTIHGIRTREDSGAWPAQFERFLLDNDATIHTEHREYYEWALPILNWFKNYFLAKALAKYLVPFAEDNAQISFLTHSNGADIGLRTIKRLAKLGFKTHAAVFIAGAIEADERKNGIGDLLESEKLGRAVAYCSKDDRILSLPTPLIWPYGHLGCAGFAAVAGLASRLITRWFKGFDHCDYFNADHQHEVFTQAVADCLHP